MNEEPTEPEEPTTPDDGLSDYERDRSSDDASVKRKVRLHGKNSRYGRNRYYDSEGNRIPSMWGEPEEPEEDPFETPEVYDEYSTQILEDLQQLESGEKKSLAEQQATKMGQQMGTAAYAVAKSRRGVAPSAMFGEGQRQSHMIQRAGTQQAAAIGKQVRQQAGEQRLQFQASKEAERRGLGAQYQAMRLQADIASRQATQGLFGSFLSFFGSLGAGLLLKSDQRIKSNIDHKAGKRDLTEFLNLLETATYDKSLYGLKRHETGIMAQSAERSKVGRQFVHEVDGVKQLNPDAALNPILGSLKLLHDRLGELEKPKKKKRGKKS
jgi:hypothetical protein